MATAKKPAPKQPVSAKKAAPAPAPAKKAAPAPAKKVAPAPAKKAAPAPAPAKKAAPAPAPAKKAAPAPAPAKKAAPAPAPAKKAAPAPVKKAAEATAAKQSAAPTKAALAPAAPAKKAVAPGAKTPTVSATVTIPPAKGVTKDGIAYTKDFDAKFLTLMRDRLLEERVALTGQATRLEAEANALVAEAEMGDVQFDDEGGEGDTMIVERERDLALSAQARQTVADIDAALVRLQQGTYGYSVISGRLIPRDRLDAIPWAVVLVEEKVGGLGRR
jgi:RNA polymerase-binding transcription factor DksA